MDVDALSTALVPTVRHVRNVQLETAVHGCAVADALMETGVIIITILPKLVSTVARPAKQKEPHRGPRPEEPVRTAFLLVQAPLSQPLSTITVEQFR